MAKLVPKQSIPQNVMPCCRYAPLVTHVQETFLSESSRYMETKQHQLCTKKLGHHCTSFVAMFRLLHSITDK